MVKEKLSNLYDIGSSKRVFQSEWREEGVPFYRAREIARLSEDGYVDNELFIDEDLYEEYTEKYGKPQPGDVMVTGVGTLGVCYVVKPEDKFYFKDGNILWFKQKAPDRILPEYLVKAFDSKEVKDFISKNSSGTTVGTFTIQTANKMEISLPTLNQQKEIIDRISKLEGIIKKRQLEIDKLDELIKARFVELFGDENNSMGWDTVNIEDVADVQVGVVIKPAQYYTDESDGIKAFRSLNIGAGYIKDNDWVYFSPEGHKKNSKSILKEDDLLIVRSGAPGTACVVPKEYEGCNAIDIIIAHPNTKKVNPHYLCAFTNMPHGKKQIEEGTGGAAQQHFNVGKYNKMKLMLPPIDKQLEYVDFVKQVDKSKVVGEITYSKRLLWRTD